MDLNFECDICFEEKDIQMNISLSCCKKKNFLCKDCSEKLLKPECPFCRVYIKSLKIKKQNKIHISFLEYDIDSFDNISYYSNIYRKKRKRLLKLQERHDNYLKNRDCLRELKKKDSKKYLNKQLKEEVREIIH